MSTKKKNEAVAKKAPAKPEFSKEAKAAAAEVEKFGIVLDSLKKKHPSQSHLLVYLDRKEDLVVGQISGDPEGIVRIFHHLFHVQPELKGLAKFALMTAK